jgi:hypothetical protein
VGVTEKEVALNRGSTTNTCVIDEAVQREIELLKGHDEGTHGREVAQIQLEHDRALSGHAGERQQLVLCLGRLSGGATRHHDGSSHVQKCARCLETNAGVAASHDVHLARQVHILERFTCNVLVVALDDHLDVAHDEHEMNQAFHGSQLSGTEEGADSKGAVQSHEVL